MDTVIQMDATKAEESGYPAGFVDDIAEQLEDAIAKALVRIGAPPAIGEGVNQLSYLRFLAGKDPDTWRSKDGTAAELGETIRQAVWLVDRLKTV